MLPLVRQNEEYQAEIKALKKDIDALENRLDRAMRRPISLEQTDEEIKQ